jgi:hypothetical protein
MEKKLLITIVLVVIASLSIAGCTTSSTVNPTPAAGASSANSPTPSATQTQATPTSSPASVPTTPQLTVATPAEIAALPTTPPTNLQSYNGPFVGSINSNVYHYPWCWDAKSILPKNLVIFATLADACAAGYRPSENCNTLACGSSTPTPTPTPTPSSSIQVIISGPTTLRDGQWGTWTATVLVNGVALSQSQLTNQIDWFIDGHAAGGSWGPGTLTTDANGSMTTWAPNGVHTLNAEYLGDPSLPNASITVTVVAS